MAKRKGPDSGVIATESRARKDLGTLYSTNDRPAPGKTTIHKIRDSEGKLIAEHVRKDQPDGDKQCFWRLPDGTWGLNGTKLPELPLYGSEQVASWHRDDLIVVVEGEKARDALVSTIKISTIKIDALGTVCGAGPTPGPEALEVLRDRRVCLWPDNDDAGRKHMDQIGRALKDVAAEVLLYTWDEAPDKGDAADHPAVQSKRPKAVDRLLTDLEGAPRWKPPKPSKHPNTIEQNSNSSTEPKPTDLGNARRFVRDHGDRVRYCYPWGKWLVYDDKRWAVDENGAVVRLMKETVRRIYVEAAAEEDDGLRRTLVNHAKRSESKTRITDALYLARSEEGVPVAPDQLDADPWLLNVQNGTIDLRTGERREHRRKDLITKMAPVEYDPEAQAPRFERFLSEVFDGDEDLSAFVGRFAGYSLTGSTEERVFAILHGRGRNGKTTLVELLEDVLGEYAATTDTETILAKRYQGVGNEVAALKGARFVATAEVERGRALAESKVKQLTGSDTVTARFLYAEPFSFKPEFKLWLSTNNKPMIRGTDDAIWDRIRLIPFNQRFEGDTADAKLPEKLRDELPGVLAWMVQGCLEWQRDGLGEPAQVLTATKDYREEMDTLGAFVDECCTQHPDAWCTFANLYAAYTAWCDKSNEHPETSRSFADRLTERGFEKGTGAKNVKIRRGIALRHDGGTDPSRVTDPDPKPDDSHPDPPHEGAENGNRVTDRPEIGNPQKTCKTEDSSERVTEGYRESANFCLVGPRRQSVEKRVTIGNSVTQGEDEDDFEPVPMAGTGPSSRRLTPEQAERVQRLVHEGMSESWARKEVLKKASKEDDFG